MRWFNFIIYTLKCLSEGWNYFLQLLSGCEKQKMNKPYLSFYKKFEKKVPSKPSTQHTTILFHIFLSLFDVIYEESKDLLFELFHEVKTCIKHLELVWSIIVVERLHLFLELAFMPNKRDLVKRPCFIQSGNQWPKVIHNLRIQRDSFIYRIDYIIYSGDHSFEGDQNLHEIKDRVSTNSLVIY